ncbi:MAG: hypothetical protein HY067_11805 [Betaproteobacteria bacterium]|nr:hypothetical protein [Betaproteobacteria bacterium]
MSDVKWTFPNDLLSTSIDMMRMPGASGNEGLALWLGRSDDDVSIFITHVIEVYGTGFSTSPLHLSLSRRAISELTDLADHLGAYLVGQIHSHPGRFIDLSELDRVQGFRVPDFLSVVCPNYAQYADTRIGDCGIHVFERGDFRRLSNAEAKNRILMSPVSVEKVYCEVNRD